MNVETRAHPDCEGLEDALKESCLRRKEVEGVWRRHNIRVYTEIPAAIVSVLLGLWGSSAYLKPAAEEVERLNSVPAVVEYVELGVIGSMLELELPHYPAKMSSRRVPSMDDVLSSRERYDETVARARAEIANERRELEASPLVRDYHSAIGEFNARAESVQEWFCQGALGLVALTAGGIFLSSRKAKRELAAVKAKYSSHSVP